MEGNGIRMMMWLVVILLVGFFAMTHSMTVLKRKVADTPTPVQVNEASETPLPNDDKATPAPKKDFQIIKPVDTVKEYEDLRWKDMQKLDLSSHAAILPTFRFNQDTLWPEGDQLPKGFDPEKVLDRAKNPGLGVQFLHLSGITGKGVNVGIIDQPLFQNHPEFKGKIAAYFDTGCESDSSMHGPAVTSLLVGEECGTAPGARVYYAAAPSWLKDAAYYAQALDWLLEQNEALPAGEKIRVVSVSAAPSGPGSPFDLNPELWDEACQRAEQADILVLDCTQHRGMIGPCYYEASDPENVAACTPGFAGHLPGGISDKLRAPTSPRTTAEQRNQGEFSYQYCGRGGLSWAIPYVSGVLALGWEVRPDLNAVDLWSLLYKTAYTTDRGDKIIDPQAFIKALQALPNKE